MAQKYVNLHDTLGYVSKWGGRDGDEVKSWETVFFKGTVFEFKDGTAQEDIDRLLRKNAIRKATSEDEKQAPDAAQKELEELNAKMAKEADAKEAAQKRPEQKEELPQATKENLGPSTTQQTTQKK